MIGGVGAQIVPFSRRRIQIRKKCESLQSEDCMFRQERAAVAIKVVRKDITMSTADQDFAIGKQKSPNGRSGRGHVARRAEGPGRRIVNSALAWTAANQDLPAGQ